MREANSAPGVVGEHVDLLVALAQLAGQRAHLGHQRQVGDVLVDRRRRRAASRLARDCRDALRLAADERELGARAGELDRGGLADPARGSGEHDERHHR